jgi:hypothetical protein
MYKLQSVIQSQIDFNILSKCIELTEIDKKSSKPLDKLSMLARSLFNLNPSYQWIFVTFYFELPQDVVDLLINTGYLKITTAYCDRDSKGFITGSIEEYLTFVTKYLTEDTPRELRVLANLLYTHFNNVYGIFLNVTIKHLQDKTFVLA